QDYFIAGPSGMGYFYPDLYPHVDSAAAITARMMQKADLSIVNVIGDVYYPQRLAPYFTQPNIDAMFYYTFDGGYVGLRGFATCFNDKPFISARYTLWQSYVTAPSLADFIRGLPHDPSVADGYTLVSVHVWDHDVDSVISAVQLLDSNVRVVPPDAFVKLFKKGTGCRLGGLSNNDIRTDAMNKLSNAPNPCSDKTEITYYLAEKNFISLKLYDATGKEVKVLYAGTQSAGDHQVTLDTHDLSAGTYAYSLSGPGINAIGRCEVVK
ncbi:MAG: GxGYxY sequence motif-containing protein, partial [Bacteroidetes bacterium]|nr:GxGYxY sequence motif-containing protein [Bacteroidota bacterium]